MSCTTTFTLRLKRRSCLVRGMLPLSDTQLPFLGRRERREGGREGRRERRGEEGGRGEGRRERGGGGERRGGKELMLH